MQGRGAPGDSGRAVGGSATGGGGDAGRLRPLSAYRRAFRPDHEAAPRAPVAAVALTALGGAPFVLVREASAADAYGRMLAWFLWREDRCVGFVGANVADPRADPFAAGAPLTTRKALRPERRVTVVRCYLADGTGAGMGEHFAPLASRGLGLMTAAYVEIVRSLSEHGWALASNPAARTDAARRLWARLAAAPGIEVVRTRAPRPRR